MANLYKCFFKRLLDIVVSAISIVVLAIPMLIIAVAIKIDSPGPVLFRQKRFGIHKSYFYIYKFRTMYIDTPKNIPTHKLKDAVSHITRVGRLLRRTSLDELPQLFNIFKNDMSMVGPRPVIRKEVDLIEERDKYGANDIKPGLTGWAQVNGRDELEVTEKAKLDGEYVNKQSFLFDMKCLLKTVVYVFKSDGIIEGCIDEYDLPDDMEEYATKQ